MSSDYQQGNQFNPYQSSQLPPPSPPAMNMAKVQAPAIAMIVFASIAILMSIYSFVYALVSKPIEMPAGTPDWQVQLAQGGIGPMAAIVQAGFLVLNLVILFGGIQMLRLKTWGMALAASILSIVDFGSCCCIAGIPLGIWALVILLMPDVKQAFETNAN
jgi:hypothetical protein